MFYELIDKIVVYEAEGVSRARTQKVDIYFNYVGQVNIDYTAEEVAEIQAQEAQTAAERLQKQRARRKPTGRSARLKGLQQTAVSL